MKYMWEHLKWSMIESTREVRGSVRVKGKNPKSVWWNDEVKVAWNEVLAAIHEEAKERCMEVCK